jgi:sigma-B regulation protein RsbU (phosphoserine phosphatase)
LIFDKIALEIALQGAKFVIILFTFLYYLYIKSKKNVPQLIFFEYIIITLAVCEFLFGVLNIIIKVSRELNLSPFNGIPNNLFFLAITNIIWITLYIRWLRQYTGKRIADFVFLVINIVVAGFVIADIVFFDVIPDYKQLLYWVWFFTNSVYFTLSLFGISKFNTKEPELILKSRFRLFMAFLFGSFYFFIPANPATDTELGFFVVQSIIIAAFYSINIYMLHQYNLFADQEQVDRVDFVEKDLESLFDFMKVISKAMAEKVGMEKILEHIITSTVKSTSADAGAILMIDEYEDILKVRAVSGFFPPLYNVPDIVKTAISRLEAYFKSTPLRLGETIFGECARSGKPIFIKNTMDDERLKHNTKNDTLYVNSVILIPLIISNRVLGVLAVLNRERGKYFTESDFKHLSTFGEYAALTIDFVFTYMELLEKREIEREIGIAADIQQKLLPKKLPKMRNAVLEAYSVPAKGVSGDYYDAFHLKGDKVALVICDVAGKGVPAALVMVMIRSILHLIASADKEVSKILTWVNKGISGQIDIDHYATMSILTFDQKTSEIEYSNAAHHPMYIYRSRTKTVETIDTEGLPIGIEKTTIYNHKKTKLGSGDIIILYTDGIIEAMNIKGEQYSSERFSQLIEDNSTLSPKEILDALKESIHDFVGNAKQHDDQTLLLMKVN